MTSTGKTWTAIIIIVVIIVIGWVWYRGSHSSAPVTQAPATTSTDASSMAASVQTGATMNASDTSNAALQQDLSSVDNQMTNLSADQSAAANTSAQ